MLQLQKISAGISEKEIVHNIDLDIKAGEIHVIMGPNGSGKSTLAHSIMGNPIYNIQNGKMIFEGEEIQNMSPDQRSHKGVFLVFQQPRTVKGVNNKNYLHTIVKSKILGENHLRLSEARKNKDLRKKLSIVSFKKNLKEQLPELDFKEEFMERSLNEGFSGGEKKKMELLQMILLQPKLAILDELDSGLDIDSLKTCCRELMKLQKKNNMSLLIITHFTRIFDYISPDFVHIFQNGTIVETGDIALAHRLEKEGYANI